jgi:hypothetical protein
MIINAVLLGAFAGFIVGLIVDRVIVYFERTR